LLGFEATIVACRMPHKTGNKLLKDQTEIDALSDFPGIFKGCSAGGAAVLNQLFQNLIVPHAPFS
jgi:hypothetical protein